MQLFNIYYINYDKAFEISMLIDNRLQETQAVTNGQDLAVHGNAEAETGNLTCFDKAALDRIYDIDVRQYHNLRKLNKEIMLRISQEYQKIEL